MNLSAVFAQCWLPMTLSAVAAYLLGSINFAIIVSKLMGLGDIRDKGSGNAGATNMLRAAGKLPAALTTVGDLLKALCAVLLARGLFVWLDAPQYARSGAYIAALLCVIGHLYPLYFGFRGGKGVLATFGVMLVLDWRVALVSLGMFIVIVLLTRFVSLGSIIAAATMVLTTFLFLRFVDMPADAAFTAAQMWFCVVVAAIIGSILIIKHRANIVRLCHGTESKLSFHKKEA